MAGERRAEERRGEGRRGEEMAAAGRRLHVEERRSGEHGVQPALFSVDGLEEEDERERASNYGKIGAL